MSKQSKIPPITQATRLLCFDLETNGLHGQAFAVGAVVMDMRGNSQQEFTARTRLTTKVDEWVKENVLPAIADMPVTHKTYEELREAFWEWYLKVEPTCDYVLVSNGYPVEYRFLLDCQEADLETRYWQHPFPVLDLSSLLLPFGELKEASKSSLLAKVRTGGSFNLHHPLHDAQVTALLAIEVFKLAGLIKN